MTKNCLLLHEFRDRKAKRGIYTVKDALKQKHLQTFLEQNRITGSGKCKRFVGWLVVGGGFLSFYLFIYFCYLIGFICRRKQWKHGCVRGSWRRANTTKPLLLLQLSRQGLLIQLMQWGHWEELRNRTFSYSHYATHTGLIFIEYTKNRINFATVFM